MPCSDPRDHECRQDERDALNLATRVACEACRLLDTVGLKSNSLSQEARDWYEEHKVLDKQRIENEKKLNKDANDRRRAIEKLSPRERKLLGVVREL